MLANTTVRPLAQPRSLASKVVSAMRFVAAKVAKAVANLPTPVRADVAGSYRGYSRSDMMTTTTRYR